MVSGIAALAVASCGYLFLRNLDNPQLTRLIRAFSLSCATAAAVRLAHPDLRPLFDTAGTDTLAVPLGVALTLCGVRFLGRDGSGFDTVLLLASTLVTGRLYPAGALVICLTLSVLSILRYLRRPSGLQGSDAGRLLLLWLPVSTAVALSAGTLMDRIRKSACLYPLFAGRMADSGWVGAGPGAVTYLLQMNDPWRFPLPVPSWPLTLTLEYGLLGLAAYGWLWLMLFRRAFGVPGDRALKTGKDSSQPQAARTVLLAVSLAMLAMPVPPVLFLMPAAGLADAFLQPGQRPAPVHSGVRPAPGLVFTLSGSLLTAVLLVFLVLNVVRLGWIARQAGIAAQAARSAWAAELCGDYPSALSGWSDAAWRTAQLAVLDASTVPGESPATAALRRAGMDRLLAETPGWFTHPDIRQKLPGQWPLVKTAPDAAHFGQARAARGMGRTPEALHWLETIGRRTTGFWPEVLAVGGILLREIGQPETGDALMRLAVEQAHALPDLPLWAPTTAQPFSRFVASLGQTAP